jgi:hypothetical protein
VRQPLAERPPQPMILLTIWLFVLVGVPAFFLLFRLLARSVQLVKAKLFRL